MRPGYLVQVGATTGRLSSVSGIGLNFSGSGIPGRNSVYGVDYIHPTLDQLKHFRDMGFTSFRLPLKWERMQPALNAALSTSEMGYLLATLDKAAELNVGIIPEIHNHALYNIGPDGVGAVNKLIGSTEVPFTAFADFWSRMATAIKDHPALIGYDLMNEPAYATNPEWWPLAAQAAVDAIRLLDTRSLIFVEGDGYSSAALWTTFNNTLAITDATGKLYYSAHSWWDANQTGTYPISYAAELALDAGLPTRGSDAIKVFADWIAADASRKGHIGEIGWPPNDANWDAVGTTALTYAASRKLPCMYWAFGGVNGSSAEILCTPGSAQTTVMRSKMASLARLVT